MKYYDLVDKYQYTPNFAYSRNGYKASHFVIHRPEGDFLQTHNTITNYAEQVSYHFTIESNGKIHCYVDPINTAWANGKIVRPKKRLPHGDINPNYYTISISLIGYATDVVTPKHYRSCAKLMAALSFDFDIKPSQAVVMLHREIRSDKSCPGYVLNKLWLTVLYMYNYLMQSIANSKTT